LQALLKKSALESSAPPSNQQHPAAPLRLSAEPQTTYNPKPAGTKLASVSEAVTNILDDQAQDDYDMVSDDGEKSIEEVLSLHYEGETYNHKENQPILPRDDQKVRRLRFVDPQPNAERVTWSQDRDEGELEAHTTRRVKRSRRDVEDEIEDDDEAFEIDPRPVDRSRREQAVRPVVQARSQLQHGQPSPKRPRTERREGAEEEFVAAAVRRREERRREEAQAEREGSQELLVAATQDEGPVRRTFQDEALQSSAQAADDIPASSYPFIHETARAAMARYRVQGGPQQRQKWSMDETETLINLIDKYGCSWSMILKKGQGVLAETRDQVALKDKARNIKVELLMYIWQISSILVFIPKFC
jgi:hypothetical protein